MPVSDGDFVNSIIIKPPTYLKDFLNTSKEICLVYVKNSSVPDEESVEYPKEVKSDISCDDLELTGNPLTIDLKEDINVSVVKCEKMNNWTLEESKYFPIPLIDARKLLNKSSRKEYATYVLCDGKDDDKTVVLGLFQTDSSFFTCFVKILGLHKIDHEYTTIKYMLKEHNSYGCGAKVDFVIRKKFFLHGHQIQLCKSLVNSEINGSVAVQTLNNDPSANHLKSKVNVMLQVIVGHETSSVNPFWQQLMLLHNYLELLADIKKCSRGDTVINISYKTESEIFAEINQVLEHAKYLNKQRNAEFNLVNLRKLDLMDLLWDILKFCKDLDSLKDSFQYLFEELAGSDVYLQTLDSNKTTVSSIVTGILTGKVAVPNLTFSQSLELLFELGAEKMLNDYSTIVENFYISSQKTILEKWHQFDTGVVNNQEQKRKTRMTVFTKSAMTNSTQNNNKLNYLGQLHTAVEFFYLIKDNTTFAEEEDGLTSFFKSLFANYLNSNSSEMYFDSLIHLRLCEISFDTNSHNIKLDENCLNTWTVKMTSSGSKFGIETIFHISENRIFPPSVFDKYDDDTSGNGKMVYISKFAKFTYLN